MKTAKSIAELDAELQRRAEAKKDYLAPTKVLELRSPVEPTGDAKLVLAADNELGITDLAHEQLASYCDIPRAYYNRCRNENPELLVHNVNVWLRRSEDKRMIRTLDGKARAFLSDRYRPVENEDLLSAIMPIIRQEDEFEVLSSEVTDKRLYVKIVHKKVNRELAKTGNFLGDKGHQIVRIAAPAITVSNSEVGSGAVSIQAGVWDQWCSNLSSFSERSMKRYHIGARHDIIGDDIVGLLSAQTQNLTNAALLSQVRDVVRAAFDQVRFNQLCDLIDGTTKDIIDEDSDVVKLVNLAGRKVGWSESESKGVVTELIKGADLTRFGLYNAVTAYSARVEDYDRATELERAGAGVVELPRNEWQSLIALAG